MACFQPRRLHRRPCVIPDRATSPIRSGGVARDLPAQEYSGPDTDVDRRASPGDVPLPVTTVLATPMSRVVGPAGVSTLWGGTLWGGRHAASRVARGAGPDPTNRSMSAGVSSAFLQ